jgi:hypothetical protein
MNLFLTGECSGSLDAERETSAGLCHHFLISTIVRAPQQRTDVAENIMQKKGVGTDCRH